jgi:cytochrome c oxidase subunit 2
VRRGSLVQLLLLTLAAFAIGAAVALVIPWMPDASSKEAGRIWFTYWFATWISLGIFAVVAAVLVYALLKFRVKEGDLSDGPPVHGHTTLEIVWTAVPFVLVTAISIVSAIVLAQNSRAGSDPLVVKVTAQQFAWQFTYPNGQTFGVLRLPKDRHVKLRITANDVIHSFWVPQFGQKQDAVPGMITKLVITPKRPGTFPVICTELCGLGHALMRSEAIVMPRDKFLSWTKSQSRGGSTSAGGAPSGKALFASNGCDGCHTFKPAGAKGTVGPDLDKLPDFARQAGQPLEQFIRESIVNPDAYVQPGYPKGVMPGTFASLPAAQLDALVKYLQGGGK